MENTTSDLLDSEYPLRCIGGRPGHRGGVMEQSHLCLDCGRTYEEINNLRASHAAYRKRHGLPRIGRAHKIKPSDVVKGHGEGI